ncbi:hypothetical protein LX32DRAFT_407688 [Colletotrichum zoysiae]|uniref:Uncharacterized protein n=1 Tax=Colletotrichum zoysiae TaxID=1216348 RepID=A0AAD9HFI9_9PEZI|nr:hypothetical protein LX32DRAFT_407688 [Colletotrichum zoysiae]
MAAAPVLTGEDSMATTPTALPWPRPSLRRCQFAGLGLVGLVFQVVQSPTGRREMMEPPFVMNSTAWRHQQATSAFVSNYQYRALVGRCV